MNNDDNEWRYWRLEDGEHVEMDLPGIDGNWSWELDYRDSFANPAQNVRKLLAGEDENHSPGGDAKRSLEIIIGFVVSHYTGSRVDIPLAGPLRDVTIKSW